jgi:hypothetical protein
MVGRFYVHEPHRLSDRCEWHSIPLHCCAKAVTSSVYSTVFAAGEPLLHVCRSQSSSKPGFHFGLLASCKDTPTCLPSSHAGEFFPPERPQSLLRGLVRPLSCRPQAELPPLPLAPQTSLRPLASFLTDVPTALAQAIPRARAARRSAAPLPQTGAASDAPRPATASSTGHV